MTVSTTTSRVDYNGSGSVGPFVYPFRIFAASDLVITKVSAAGVESTLSYPADFDVAGVGDLLGGTVTLHTALATGERAVIRRVRPLTQNTDLRSLGRFSPDTHEATFDHLTMLAQQHAEELARAVKMAVSSRSTNPTLPTPQSGAAIGWDVSGNFQNIIPLQGIQGVKGDTGASGAPGTGVSTTPTLASRDLLTPSTLSRILVTETGEGYRWNGTKYVVEQNRPMQVINTKAKGALADNSGMTIAAYNTSIGQPSTYRRSDWVGVYADTDTMDYAGVQEAIYAAFGPPGAENANAQGLNYALYAPGGNYRFNRTPKVTRAAGAVIYGDGRFTTKFWMDAANRACWRTNGFSSSSISAIGFYQNPSVNNPLDFNNANGERRDRGVLFELDWDTKGSAAPGLADTAVASATPVAIGPASAVAWTTNQFAGKWCFIVAGSGATGSLDAMGTMWKIKGNSANQLFIDDKWTVAIPDGTTKFVITDTPSNRNWDGRPYARGAVGDTASGGAAVTATTLPKMANNTSYWSSKGAFDKDGFDSRLWAVNSWTNAWVLITSGTGAGQYRQITSNTDRVLTVATAWAVNPDTTSSYIILPNAPTGIDANTPFTADPAKVSDASLMVAGAAWTVNQFQDQEVWITAGTGKGEKQYVASNTANTLIPTRPWDVTPDATSTVRIIARPAWSASLQANRFTDLQFSAEGADVGAGTRCVLHGDSAQGSEMHFQNCFYNWFRNANHINLGFNALQNTWVSGNFQSHRGHGWWVVSGAIQSFDVGLQTDRLGALYNGGYDFFAVNSAGDHSLLVGNRSEGYRSISGGNYHSVTAIGFSSNSFPPTVWGPNNSGYAVGDLVYPTNSSLLGKQALPYCCIKSGQTGAVEPNFNGYTYGEELTDGTVIWSAYRVQVVTGENINAKSCAFNLGTMQLPVGTNTGSYLDNVSFSRPDWWDPTGAVASPHGIVGLRGVHVHKRGLFNDSTSAMPYSIPGSTRLFRSVQLAGGGEGILFAGGQYSGANAFPVGLRRGAWSGAAASEAILGVIGILGREDPVDHYSAGESTPPNYLVDIKGEKQVIAGGRSTGAATGANPLDAGDGEIDFQTSPPGTTGSAVNALVSRLTIDKYGTATTKNGLVRLPQPITVAAAGTVTIDCRLGSVVRITANGSFTMADPLNPQDGQELEIEVFNNTGGAIVITQASSFAVAIAPPATTKRATVRVRYNAAGGRNKWAPITPQTTDYP